MPRVSVLSAQVQLLTNRTITSTFRRYCSFIVLRFGKVPYISVVVHHVKKTRIYTRKVPVMIQIIHFWQPVSHALNPPQPVPQRGRHTFAAENLAAVVLIAFVREHR